MYFVSKRARFGFAVNCYVIATLYMFAYETIWCKYRILIGMQGVNIPMSLKYSNELKMLTIS